MCNSVAICTKHLTLFDFFFYTIKSNGTTETSYTEQLIFTFFMMEIKYSWVSNSTSTTPTLCFIFVNPLKIALYERLFS